MPVTRAELEGLKTRLGEIEQSQTAMLDEATEKNGGVLTDEQRDDFDKLSEESDQKTEEAQRIFGVLKTRGVVDKLTGIANRKTESGALAGDDGERLQEGPFDSFGEQLLAIYNGSMQNPEPELIQKLAATGSSSGIDSKGGFLVQKDFSAELWRRMYEVGQVAGRCRRIPIGPNADGLKMNAIDETSRATGSRFGGIRAHWKAEAAQMTASTPTLRQMEVSVEDLTGLWYATDRLLQDSTALEAVARQAFPEEFAFVIDDALIRGDGAGKPTGILNAGATVSVAKETGQAAATIQYKNIIKMWARMWGRSRPNAVWFVNQDIEPQLYQLDFPVGTGGVPVFLPPGGASATPYASLFGRPLIPIEHAATLGTVGDIILADMSQYLIVEKGGVQSDSSIHLRFDYNETAFRWIARINGQSLWDSALTPFKGSNTQSPFVTLATRA